MGNRRMVLVKEPRLVCMRCGLVYDGGRSDAAKWNAVFDRGALVGGLCPDCQTPEEDLEAQANEATIDYEVVGGYVCGFPKGGSR